MSVADPYVGPYNNFLSPYRFSLVLAGSNGKSFDNIGDFFLLFLVLKMLKPILIDSLF